LSAALKLFDQEGGQAPHLARYTANMRVFVHGLKSLDLHAYVSPALQGPIVVNVRSPVSPAWDLSNFVDGLRAEGWDFPLPLPARCIGLGKRKCSNLVRPSLS
jgi:2-aminoethylphosphonate-pyruvate transaminase